jgi:prevent-host-death family protein
MRTVGIKVLKNKLSEYIRAAAAGETVSVTDRGRVVAEIVPPRIAADATPAEQKWAELIRQGLVTPAKRPLPPLPPREQSLISFEELMRDLDESRSDR